MEVSILYTTQCFILSELIYRQYDIRVYFIEIALLSYN